MDYRITKAEFVTSVADYERFPDLTAPEITVVGRSNVGKSSFINVLANQSKLARTSSTPGRTRLINIFDFNNNEFMLVDLPGYGYQHGSKQDAKKWAELLERYLQYRMEIKQVFFLLDIRHAPSEQDLHMVSYLNYLRIPFTVVASKADKLSRAEINKNLSMLDSYIGVGVDNIIPFSSVTKYNKERVLNRIHEIISI